MSSLSAYVFVLVMVVQFQSIISKPFFTELFCDLFCDDDDSTTTSASTEDDIFGFGDLCSCTPSTRRPPTTGASQGNIPSAINMRLPPSMNGIDLKLVNNNGMWSFDLDAVPTSAGNLAPTNGPTTNAPTTAAGTTAAAGATTAAAASTAAK